MSLAEDTRRELRRRKMAREREAAAGPGIIGAFHRGLLTSPATTMPESQAVTPGKPGFERPAWSEQMPEATYQALLKQHLHDRNAVDIKAPKTSGERIAQGIGQDTPFIAAGALAAPLFAPAAPLMAGAAEMGLGTLGSGVSRTIEEGGGGAAAQMGGEIAATAAAPLAIPWKVAKKVAARSAVDGMSDMAIAAAAQQAKKHGYSTEAWLRASSELKRKFARGKKDPDKFIRKASAQLGKDIDAFGENTPTLAQSAGEYGGNNIASLELQYAKHDQDYAADVLGQRLEVQESLDRDFSSAKPRGNIGATREGFFDAQISANQIENEAWQKVREGDAPWVWTGNSRRSVANLDKGYPVSRKYIPEEARHIRKWDYFEKLPAIQAVRSELLDSARAGAAFNATDLAKRRSKRVQQILEPIQRSIESLGEFDDAIGFAAADYKAAREITKHNAELFSHKSAAVDALWNLAEGGPIVRRIKGAKDSVSEVKRLKSIFKEDPEAFEGIKDAAWVDLFGEQLGDKSAKRMASEFATKRGFYTELYGKDGADFMVEIIRRQKVAATGKAGTAAQAAATGTGQSIIDQLVSFSGDARNPAWSMATKGGRYLADKALSRGEVMILMREATKDIRLAKALLDAPTQRAEPAWRIVMDQSVNRIRSQAKKTATRGAARRPFNDDGGD